MANDRLSRRGFLAASCLAIGTAGCNAPSLESTPENASAPNEQPELINTTPESPSAYTDVYRATIDSVVMITVYDRQRGNGQGSGFVYDDRHVVTNEHVVGDTDEVEVRFSDGAWRTSTVVGTDFYSDLAVVEIADMPDAAGPLPLVEGEVATGQQVLAIGNPFGLSGSLSAGIVSGVDRAIPAGQSRDGPNFSIPDAIQTDAPVNPGNSGGPLMTLDGEVAGVVNAGSGDNIGFAISAALMRRVVPALIDNGEYEHSFMGVFLRNVTPLIAQANGLDGARGVYIDGTMEDGPAEGILEGSTKEEIIDGVSVPVGGDVVVSLDGETIHTQQALSTYLALATSPGDTLRVGIVRDGIRRTVSLTLGSRPKP